MEIKNFFKKKLSKELNIKNNKRRIWSEIFKVLISSDIILYILDCRDPLGTFCISIKKKIFKLKKRLIIILNKCDLVPTWIITKWIKIFSKENIVFSFHSDIKGNYGKGCIINIIRQIKATYFWNKKNLILGVLGYPNVGKSTFINTLKGKKVVGASIKTGETKVWQFVKLFNKIYIIDSPGIIPNLRKDDIMKIIRGGIRFEKIRKIIFEFSPNFKKLMAFLDKKNHAHNQNLLSGSNIIFFSVISKLEKGGIYDRFERTIVQIKKFIEGRFSWYAPVPKKKKKNLKLLEQKHWILDKKIKCF